MNRERLTTPWCVWLFTLFFWWALATPTAAANESPLVVAVGKDDYITAGPRKNLGIYPLNVNLAEGLTTFDEHFNLKPCLATSWEYLGEGRWRFYLREKVTFHDGTPLDASAVQHWLERQHRLGATFFNCHSLEVVSPLVLDIVTQEENRLLPYILSHPYLGILKNDDPPMGTGPFLFQAYEKGQYLKVKRNEHYWREKSPLPAVLFRFLPEASQRLMALQSGEVEVALDIPWESLRPLQKDPSFRLHLSPPGAYVALMINPNGTLRDRELRRLVAMALDRKAIAEVLWQGQGHVRQTLIPQDLLGRYASLIPDLTLAPSEAREKLAGKKVALTLVAGFPDAQSHGQLPEIIQAQLQKIGLQVKLLRINDVGLYHTLMKQGQGDLWLEKGHQNSSDPTFLPYLLFHPQGYYPRLLQTAAGTPLFCRLLEEARTSGNLDTMRENLALALKEVIFQEVMVIPLATLPQVVASRAGIRIDRLHPSPLHIRWDQMARK